MPQIEDKTREGQGEEEPVERRAEAGAAAVHEIEAVHADDPAPAGGDQRMPPGQGGEHEIAEVHDIELRALTQQRDGGREVEAK